MNERMEKKRGGNFCRRERDVLVEEVVSAYGSLFSKFVSGGGENRKRKAKWEEITEKINAQNEEEERTVGQVKKKWQDLKKITKAKEAARNRHAKGTGGGPPPPPLSPVYEKILSVLPKCSVDGIAAGADTMDSHTVDNEEEESVEGPPHSPYTPVPSGTPGPTLLQSTPVTPPSTKKGKRKAVKRSAERKCSFEDEYLEVQRGILEQLKNLVDVQTKILQFQTTSICVVQNEPCIEL